MAALNKDRTRSSPPSAAGLVIRATVWYATPSTAVATQDQSHRISIGRDDPARRAPVPEAEGHGLAGRRSAETPRRPASTVPGQKPAAKAGAAGGWPEWVLARTGPAAQQVGLDQPPTEKATAQRITIANLARAVIRPGPGHGSVVDH